MKYKIDLKIKKEYSFMVKKKSSKKGDEKGEKKVSKKVLSREDKQLAWFFAIIALVFVAFLGGYFYVQSLKTFEYHGVNWERIKFGELDLYHTKVPIIYRGKFYLNYNLYFRTDPRENDVPVNATMSFWPNLIITSDKDAWKCSDTKKAYGDLKAFLTEFPQIKNITGAYSDEDYANLLNEDYATCDNATEGTSVIRFRYSDEPRIYQESDDCFVVEVGQCESVKAEEKFVAEFVRQLNIQKVE